MRDARIAPCAWPNASCPTPRAFSTDTSRLMVSFAQRARTAAHSGLSPWPRSSGGLQVGEGDYPPNPHRRQRKAGGGAEYGQGEVVRAQEPL